MATVGVQTRWSVDGGDDSGAPHTPCGTPTGGPTSAAKALTTQARCVEEFFQTLARAVRQFHTYPVSSPHCVQAVDESFRVLSRLSVDSIVCVVAARQLVIDGVAMGRDTPIEHQLARRLRAFRCTALTIERSASKRELASLCTELAARPHRKGESTSLDERLRAAGTQRISVSAAWDPVLLDVEASADACAEAEAERQRQEATHSTDGLAQLYPADKGWVRVDPDVPLDRMTLCGVARLVEDPASLAGMLARLAGESQTCSSPADALEAQCEDVARLYAALDPDIGRVRVARLAAAVLALDSPRRRRLLTTKLLPGLVDGRTEGDILRHFPDVDLADALSLLLDVETAAPELLNSALGHLHLPPERQSTISPLLEERILTKDPGSVLRQDAALQERTQQLVQVVNGTAPFHEFAAHDLQIDRATEAVIAATAEQIRSTNLPDVQLACASQLVALHADGDNIDGLVRVAMQFLAELERAQHFTEMARRLESLQQTARTVGASRPAVAASIREAIESFYTPMRFERLVSMYAGDDRQRASANRIILAAGPSLTAAAIRTLDSRAADERVLQLVCDHAGTFAPAIAKLLDHLAVPQRVAAIRALATAGRGYEATVARQLLHENDRVIREALTALVRVGSEEAAEFVARHVQRTGHGHAGMEQVVWQFAPAVRRHCLRSLLRQRAFVSASPATVLRLLQPLDRREAAALADVLTPLTPLRFHFWNRALMRVGRQAAALLR